MNGGRVQKWPHSYIIIICNPLGLHKFININIVVFHFADVCMFLVVSLFAVKYIVNTWLEVNYFVQLQLQLHFNKKKTMTNYNTKMTPILIISSTSIAYSQDEVTAGMR